MRRKGKIDEESQQWFCADCWAAFADVLEKEGDDSEQRKMGKKQECGECGEMKQDGGIEQESGIWFCNACWARLESTPNEEYECGECGEMKKEGRTEEESGIWFCNDCWARLEEEAVVTNNKDDEKHDEKVK